MGVGQASQTLELVEWFNQLAVLLCIQNDRYNRPP